jgi:uncharacterized repeat protein (TIGR03803 family)
MPNGVVRKTGCRALCLGAALLAAPLPAAPALARGQAQALYSFAGPPDGAAPGAPVLVGKTGALFGTTVNGGLFDGSIDGYGTVFELTPPAGAGAPWQESVLYRFTGGSDGGFAAGLTPGPSGSLYGVTHNGGTAGAGVVYKLSPSAGGAWQQTVLHEFGTGAGTDGAIPYGSVIVGAGGALFGTTLVGGKYNNGTIFMLTQAAGGAWSETRLYDFTGHADGGRPQAALLADSAGALYGTASMGGGPGCNGGCGTVFKLTPPASTGAAWTQSVLHTFTGLDGALPTNPLIADADGAFYSTTNAGGVAAAGPGFGTVFKLSPPAVPGGDWTLATLYTFTGGALDGDNAGGGVIFGPGGALFGTSHAAQDQAESFGDIYKLTPSTPGAAWTFSLVSRFSGPAAAEGNATWANLTAGPGGALLGVTVAGGTHADGTVFEITP